MIGVDVAALGMVLTFVAGLVTCYGWLTRDE